MPNSNGKAMWSDSEGSDWEELEETPALAQCLFCPQVLESSTAVFAHTKQAHNFDFFETVQRFELDFYGSTKLINYIRRCTTSSTVVDLESREFFNEKYLIPVIQNDPLLFEGLSVDESDEEDEKAVLQKRLDALQSNFEGYKEQVRKLIESRPAESDAVDKAHENDIDGSYFSSYGYIDIHETMLKDKVRTDAYRDFIYENKHVFEGKTVLDIGCGTGILSMLAARAGARHVYSVDKSMIIEKARLNIFENGFGEVITCIKSTIEDLSLPVEKVDIIISEWMGYGLLYESMLDSVLSGRDRFLTDSGLMAPTECRLLLAGITSESLISEKVDFWKNVYGFKMTAMIESVYEDALIDTVSDESVSTSAETVFRLPLHTIKISELSFTKPFTLYPIRQETTLIHGFVIWFDTYFSTSRESEVERAEDRSGMIYFSTGPNSSMTHWKQTICLIKDSPIELSPDDKLCGQLTYAKSSTSKREIDVTVEWALGSSLDRVNRQHYRLR